MPFVMFVPGMSEGARGQRRFSARGRCRREEKCSERSTCNLSSRRYAVRMTAKLLNIAAILLLVCVLHDGRGHAGALPDHNVPKGGFITTPDGVKIHYLEA